MIENDHSLVENLVPLDTVQSFQTINRNTLRQLDQVLPSSPIVEMNQVHSNNVFFLSNEYYQSQISTIQENRIIIPQTDAIFTKEKNILLAVRTADCLPILFAHPEGVIGLIHAGRAGTEDQITAKTFERIRHETGLNKGFLAWFGPAICSSCYQIDATHDHYYDLIQKNIDQLCYEVELSQIFKSNLCTACRHDLFYSYRKGDLTDRNYSLIMQH